jgi:hypothetical protein
MSETSMGCVPVGDPIPLRFDSTTKQRPEEVAAGIGPRRFGALVRVATRGLLSDPDAPMLAGVTDEYCKGPEAGVPFPSRLGHFAEYAQLAQMIVEHVYLNGEAIRMDRALRMAPR